MTQHYRMSHNVFPPAIPEGRWEDLTLADNIVFGSVMMRADLCKRLIELCLQIPIDHIEYIQTEKDIHALPHTPGVRLDVYVGDGTGRVFNVELQRKDEKYIGQRSRFYQASICYEMAEQARRKAREEGRRLTWDERYGSLRESYVIFLCLADPFGRGWKRYVFRNSCVGAPDLELGDGTCEVFLNAKWTEPGCDDGDKKMSVELDAFLSYLAGEYHGDDEYVRALDDEVRSVVTRPEWRKHIMFEYEQWEDMAAWIEKNSEERGIQLGLERGMQKGLEEGRQRGLEQGIEQGLEQGLEQGVKLGRAEQNARLAKLAEALRTVGRETELLGALGSEDDLGRLFEEFGV